MTVGLFRADRRFFGSRWFERTRFCLPDDSISNNRVDKQARKEETGSLKTKNSDHLDTLVLSEMYLGLRQNQEIRQQTEKRTKGRKEKR